eukprot:7152994-Lingulodinium_polyedra.AAC.1
MPTWVGGRGNTLVAVVMRWMRKVFFQDYGFPMLPQRHSTANILWQPRLHKGAKCIFIMPLSSSMYWYFMVWAASRSCHCPQACTGTPCTGPPVILKHLKLHRLVAA